jgi:leader peptidase (prepilin peptidase)/N-methyltransferase
MWPGGEPGWALLLTGVAAWLWGSYLNQLIDRTPLRDGTGAGGPTASGAERPPGPPPGVSLLRPRRSVCFACGRRLAWHDNVPVASWLWLRGRCRTCGAPIGSRTLVVEAATPLLLTAWHALWMASGAAPALLAWGLGAGSALIVAAGLVAGRRRWPPWLWGALAVLAALAALAPWALAP